MLSSKLLLVVSVVAAQIGDDIEGILTEIKVNISSGLDDFQENIDKTAVIEVDLEEIILGSLQDCLHAGNSTLVVRVDLHHFHEVLMSV